MPFRPRQSIHCLVLKVTTRIVKHKSKKLQGWHVLKKDKVFLYLLQCRNHRGARGLRPPKKIWAWKKFFPKVFALLFHRFNTKTFCKEDVEEARFSHYREWKIGNFLARRPQPWWCLLSYNTILGWPLQYQKRGYGIVLNFLLLEHFIIFILNFNSFFHFHKIIFKWWHNLNYSSNLNRPC